MRGETGLLEGLAGDGRPLLMLTAVALLLSGGFAMFLAVRREFLPHDVAFLGMSADRLCALAACRVVRFMFHDRVAFGGSLLAIATLYLWRAAFPLRDGERWAWWTFALSGTLGFGSFLAYLGYGYLDSWHGIATLALLPIVIAGLVILTVGTTRVFVAEDLAYIGLTREMLDQVNPRIVPLIAHDRAGFGGGLATAGLLVALCAWYARPTRAFHQAVVLAGTVGFGCAIGVHYVEGYTNIVHLAPAFAGAALFAASVLLEIAGATMSGPCTSRSGPRRQARRRVPDPRAPDPPAAALVELSCEPSLRSVSFAEA
jgi:hypothetical protein